MKYNERTKLGVVTDYMSGRTMKTIARKWGIATPKLASTLVSDLRKEGFSIPTRNVL